MRLEIGHGLYLSFHTNKDTHQVLMYQAVRICGLTQASLETLRYAVISG